MFNGDSDHNDDGDDSGGGDDDDNRGETAMVFQRKQVKETW